jgi:hypothetical protein
MERLTIGEVAKQAQVRIATRALAISESQEQRRRPQLGIYQANGYRRYLPERQLFSFLVSVTNPTDINNSIAQAELQVTYLLEGDIMSTCRIPHNLSIRETLEALNAEGVNVFSLPSSKSATRNLERRGTPTIIGTLKNICVRKDLLSQKRGELPERQLNRCENSEVTGCLMSRVEGL